MTDLLKKLEGGDLRSIGRSNEVVAQVLKSAVLLNELFDGLFHDDKCVRARASDALEKISVRHPEWLEKYRVRLLRDVVPTDQKEVQWHVAQMLGRVKLTSKQRTEAVRILRNYLKGSASQIVKVSALQALTDISEYDRNLQPMVSKLVGEALRTGSPSLKARARKLLGSIS